MPLYEFQCETCQKVTERIQKFSDPPMEACPACGGPVKKLVSSPAIQFKGTGWYITDYARKSGNGSGKSASGGASDTSGKTEPGESEKSEKSEKTETKKTEPTSTPSKSDT